MRAILAVVLLAVHAAGGAAPLPPNASPLVVEPGADVGSAYLPALAIRDDGGLDAQVVGVPGATLRLTDAFHVTNRGAGPLSIGLAPHEPAQFWSVGLGSPSAREVFLAPGETLVGQLVLALPEGTEASRAAFDVIVQVHP